MSKHHTVIFNLVLIECAQAQQQFGNNMSHHKCSLGKYGQGNPIYLCTLKQNYHENRNRGIGNSINHTRFLRKVNNIIHRTVFIRVPPCAKLGSLDYKNGFIIDFKRRYNDMMYPIFKGFYYGNFYKILRKFIAAETCPSTFSK